MAVAQPILSAQRATDTPADGAVFEQIKARQRDPPIHNQSPVIAESIGDAHRDHYLTITGDDDFDLDGFAKAGHARMRLSKRSKIGYLADRDYEAPPEQFSNAHGMLSDSRSFAQIAYTFDNVVYLIYHVVWLQADWPVSKYFILSPQEGQVLDDDSGDSPLNDKLIAAVSKWSTALHDEIYIFDAGRWKKSTSLYKAVQKTHWEDVILDHSTKASIISDVNAFFDNKSFYTMYNVPWKRGIIMYGSPGNGKTTTIRALMQELGNREDDPISSLYVKGLKNCHGGEYAIERIFHKARKRAPCLLVFEDLDSLVTDELRSYFLNEVDGLEPNDGILMLGSTNHLDKLDPAIAKRPSRFDRKYRFEVPESEQRLLYAQYWQDKIKSNPGISFPSTAAKFVVDITNNFSYAYMKELFVTSLIVAIGHDGTQAEDKVAGSKLSNGDHGVDKGDIREVAKSTAAQDEANVPDTLKDNKFVQILLRQAATLRLEMESVINDEKDKASAEDEKDKPKPN